MKRVRVTSDVDIVHPKDQLAVTWAAEQQRWVELIADIIEEKAVGLVAEAASLIESQIGAAQEGPVRYEPKVYKTWACVVRVLPSILVPFGAMPTHDVHIAKDMGCLTTIDFTMGCDTWTAFARGHRSFCSGVIKMVVRDLADNRIKANSLIRAIISGLLVSIDPHGVTTRFQLSTEQRQDTAAKHLICSTAYPTDTSTFAEARNI